jgi:hypothetical protein
MLLHVLLDQQVFLFDSFPMYQIFRNDLVLLSRILLTPHAYHINCFFFF